MQTLVFDGKKMQRPVLRFTVGKAFVPNVDYQGTLSVVEDHDGTVLALTENNSLGLPKKSYGIELQDDAGLGKKQPLVGLLAGTDWILHSCGQDHTCMRNALSYALGRDEGRYASRTRFTEISIDGKYQGIYVVAEKIKQDKNPLDLATPAPLRRKAKDWVASTPDNLWRRGPLLADVDWRPPEMDGRKYARDLKLIRAVLM